MPENWVELILAILIAAVCFGVPLLIVVLVLDLTDRRRRRRK
jgi:hypothetical protein